MERNKNLKESEIIESTKSIIKEHSLNRFQKSLKRSLQRSLKNSQFQRNPSLGDRFKTKMTLIKKASTVFKRNPSIYNSIQNQSRLVNSKKNSNLLRSSIVDLKTSLALDPKVRKHISMLGTNLRTSQITSIKMRNIRPEFKIYKKRIINFNNKFDPEVGKLKKWIGIKNKKELIDTSIQLKIPNNLKKKKTNKYPPKKKNLKKNILNNDKNNISYKNRRKSENFRDLRNRKALSSNKNTINPIKRDRNTSSKLLVSEVENINAFNFNFHQKSRKISDISKNMFSKNSIKRENNDLKKRKVENPVLKNLLSNIEEDNKGLNNNLRNKFKKKLESNNFIQKESILIPGNSNIKFSSINDLKRKMTIERKISKEKHEKKKLELKKIEDSNFDIQDKSNVKFKKIDTLRRRMTIDRKKVEQKHEEQKLNFKKKEGKELLKLNKDSEKMRIIFDKKLSQKEKEERIRKLKLKKKELQKKKKKKIEYLY